MAGSRLAVHQQAMHFQAPSDNLAQGRFQRTFLALPPVFAMVQRIWLKL
jgi:hypothetical protein